MSLITDAASIPAGHPVVVEIGKELEFELRHYMFEPITSNTLYMIEREIQHYLEACMASERIHDFATQIHHTPTNISISAAIKMHPGTHFELLTLHLL